MNASLKQTFKIRCTVYFFDALTSSDCLVFLIAFLDTIPSAAYSCSPAFIASPAVTCQTYPDFGYYNIGTKSEDKKNLN
jgi:hypothetical protein